MHRKTTAISKDGSMVIAHGLLSNYALYGIRMHLPIGSWLPPGFHRLEWTCVCSYLPGFELVQEN
jgi:hypothetical protein